MDRIRASIYVQGMQAGMQTCMRAIIMIACMLWRRCMLCCAMSSEQRTNVIYAMLLHFMIGRGHLASRHFMPRMDFGQCDGSFCWAVWQTTQRYCFKRVQAEQILALFLLHIQANTLGLPSARRSASAECVGSASLSEMAGSDVGATELPADDVSIRVVRTLLADWSVLPGATLKSWASAMARRGVQRDHSSRSQRIASAKCQWASPARTFASFICSARAYVCMLASVPQLRGGVRAQQADTRFWFRREMNGSAMTHARPCLTDYRPTSD